MASGIKLISTDFDGTLIGHPSDGRCTPALGETLTEFKASGGQWAMNTGRSLAHSIEGIEIFQAPIEPDYILTQEREIYHRDEEGTWRDLGEWNLRSREHHGELFHRAGSLLAQIHDLVAALPDVTMIEENGAAAGLITTDEAAMIRVADRLDTLRAAIPKFNYQRNTIYLRFCHADYHKGATLGELSRMLGLKPAEVFAAGDHYNDLSMLQPCFAAHLGCPSNAIAEVKAAVVAGGGYVSALKFGDGTADALSGALRHIGKEKPAAIVQ